MKFVSSAVVLGVASLVSTPFDIAAAQSLSAKQISAIAKTVTVRIDGQNPGSGVLIERQNNVYTVLTAAHVIETEDEYDLVTPDGVLHPIAYSRVEKFAGVDLALVNFTSSKSYDIVEFGDSSQTTSGESVFVSGYPMPTAAITDSILTFTAGSVAANAQRPLADGYALVYTNNTLPGMSGGAVLNDQGQLIGIHGRADAEQQVQRTETIYLKTGFNLGIPVNTFLALSSNENRAVGLSSATPSLSPANMTADDWFAQAIGKHQKRDYRGAIGDYSQVIRLKPNDASAYLRRALARFWLGEYQASVTDYSQSLRLNPNDESVYSNRAIALSKLGEKQKALEDYTRSLRLKPMARTYFNRGVVYADTNQRQRAIADYTQALQLEPDYADAYNNRGFELAAIGQDEKALADYNRAIEFDPNLTLAFSNRAQLHHRLGNYSQAIADYKEVLRDSSDDWVSIINLGLLEYELGRPKIANQYWARATGLDPNSPEPQFALAVSLYREGKLESGLALARKALVLDSKFSDSEFLQKNLWGQELISDARKMLIDL